MLLRLTYAARRRFRRLLVEILRGASCECAHRTNALARHEVIRRKVLHHQLEIMLTPLLLVRNIVTLPMRWRFLHFGRNLELLILVVAAGLLGDRAVIRIILFTDLVEVLPRQMLSSNARRLIARMERLRIHTAATRRSIIRNACGSKCLPPLLGHTRHGVGRATGCYIALDRARAAGT